MSFCLTHNISQLAFPLPSIREVWSKACQKGSLWLHYTSILLLCWNGNMLVLRNYMGWLIPSRDLIYLGKVIVHFEKKYWCHSMRCCTISTFRKSFLTFTNYSLSIIACRGLALRVLPVVTMLAVYRWLYARIYTCAQLCVHVHMRACVASGRSCSEIWNMIWKSYIPIWN